MLTSPEGRKQFILNLTPRRVIEGLILINGALRGKSAVDHKLDGDTTRMADIVPPDMEDKEVLLADALRAAQTILGREPDVQNGLETASLLLSGVLQYLHLFDDGNGRMSRFFGALIP